ncbi:MAG: PepSY domain-containing protein [Anaerolineales bacterium]|uniref:PepSY domain-containing protein n=1 Tax=Candidatus Desulfolinea nitratireducens TaxID=2841698 RepID=A0A8J6TJD1_9CHLR|nr:PepSY domain-containing protein [Candidatus Desulfolinea nitratireducens]MBL6960524.1 PepSY domain-containing protein [Anaerolineales bacterium]
MKKTLIWAGVIVIALVPGVGAAALMRTPLSPFGMMGQGANGSSFMDGNGYGGMMGQGTNGSGYNGYGMMNGGMMGQGTNGSGYNGHGMMNGGMMGTWNNLPVDLNAPRISLDQALEAAQNYAVAYYGETVAIEEVMEFEANFYALFAEADTGRGAFELLVDPYTGNVSPEPGPNMMWNLKYGHMGSSSGDNTISLEEARQFAEQSLDGEFSNAELAGEGASFYGYYTFDYAVDGKIAGMLSIHGQSGQAFYHTWHGAFIQEEEYHQ